MQKRKFVKTFESYSSKSVSNEKNEKVNENEGQNELLNQGMENYNAISDMFGQFKGVVDLSKGEIASMIGTVAILGATGLKAVKDQMKENAEKKAKLSDLKMFIDKKTKK